MYRQSIYEEFEEIASEICMKYNADASCFPESVIDSMTDDFIARYVDGETDRLPDEWDVIKAMCNYIQG